VATYSLRRLYKFPSICSIMSVGKMVFVMIGLISNSITFSHLEITGP
jgi:hypothetical protein